MKKPNIEDAYAGAFMAGADFVPPKKRRHEPLIKFLGKRAHLKEEVQDVLQTPCSNAVCHRSLDCCFPGMCSTPMARISLSHVHFYICNVEWNLLKLYAPSVWVRSVPRNTTPSCCFGSTMLGSVHLNRLDRIFCFCHTFDRTHSSYTQQEEASAQTQGAVRHRHSPGALDFSQVVGGAMFGRPMMTEEEMAAVDSGGAENAPKVYKPFTKAD